MKSIKKRIKIIIKFILYKTRIFSLPFYIFRIFPIKNNKIICSNFYDKGYGDNPKYVIEELLNRNKKYDIVWIVKDETINSFPKGIRTVKKNTLKYVYEIVTAKIWLFNCRKSIALIKRKNQYYIQTWHGSFPLKKIEKDAIEKLDNFYIQKAISDSKAINLMISNGKFCTDMYKRAFWYKGNIIECGTPRNDILINSNRKKIKDKVYSFYNLKNDENIILYAPTFREKPTKNPYDINFENVISKLKEVTKKDWRILIRLHPNEKNLEKFKNTETIINASNYLDVQELLIASNIVITDYSSIMFEAMLINIPVILYANDIENYTKNERGFYFDFKDLPFELTENNIQLCNCIEENNFNKIIGNYNSFKEKNGIIENGNASKKICDIIENICEEY